MRAALGRPGGNGRATSGETSEMEHVASDMLYDYYEVKITSPYTRGMLLFRLEDDTESLIIMEEDLQRNCPVAGQNISSFHILEERIF